MGAYKARTGKTRVGNALSKVGGFFSGIFAKKIPTATNGNTGTTPTVIPKGATQGINGNPQVSGSFWGELATVVGTAGLAFLGTKIPSNENPSISVAEQIELERQSQEDAKNTGSGIFVTIGLVILALIAFFYFRSRR